MRRLIVNADDFGLTPGVNRAIAEAHNQGIVTSTTLMANSASFEDAVRLARTSSTWSVGCHVVLLDGSPVIDPARVSSLVQRGSSHSFRNGIGGFAVRALTGWIDSDQVEAEVTAQIRKLQAAGVDVSHIDTHKHTHMFPGALPGVLRAARTCGVRAIRNPFEMIAANYVKLQRGMWKRHAQLKTLNGFAGAFRRAVGKAGLRTPDGTLGIVATGHLTPDIFHAIAEHMPEGTWEFVCHPGYVDADLDAIRTRLRQSREQELAVLTSPETRKVLAARGIELISYLEL